MRDIIKNICKKYKEAVSQNGPDGTPGLNNVYSEDEMYDIVMKNYDKYNNMVVYSALCEGKGYTDINDLKEDELWIAMYYLGVLLNEIRFNNHGYIKTEPVENRATISVEEDKENKKEFIKEVMAGIERKKTLRDFLTDPRSYKQFRNEVDRCLLYMDWSKIHAVMEALDWTWCRWIDNEGDEHYDSTPSVFGIQEHVYDMIKRMEDWILEHGDTPRYLSGTGGFDYEMWVCDPEDENDPDDFDHRIRFVVRFVAEQYDTGM